jgi:hypothetical protein
MAESSAFEAAQAAMNSLKGPDSGVADNVIPFDPEAPSNSNTDPRPAFIDEDAEEVSLEPSTDTQSKKSTESSPTVLLDVKLGDKVSKIKVDMSNTEQIQKAIVASVQAKHIVQKQNEQLAAYKAQVEDLRDAQVSFGQVEQAFKSQGIQGLVNLMAGKEGAYEEFLQKQVTRELLKRDASPVELERLELEEKLERLEKSVQASESKAKQYEAQSQQKMEQAEKTRIEGAIQPAFDKHRFAGQLGDPVLEARMDKAIWVSAMDELKEFAEQNGQAAVTAQVSNRIFEDIAKGIKGAFSVQANKEASVSSEKRKADAGFQVAAAAMAGQGTSNSRQSDKKLYNEYLRAGNYSGMLELQRSGRVK